MLDLRGNFGARVVPWVAFVAAPLGFIFMGGMVLGQCQSPAGPSGTPSVQVGNKLPTYTTSGAIKLTPAQIQTDCQNINTALGFTNTVDALPCGTTAPTEPTDGASGTCDTNSVFYNPDANCPSGPGIGPILAMGTPFPGSVTPQTPPEQSPSAPPQTSTTREMNGQAIKTVNYSSKCTNFAAGAEEKSSQSNTASSTPSSNNLALQSYQLDHTTQDNALVWIKGFITSILSSSIPNSPTQCDTNNNATLIGSYFKNSVSGAYGGLFSDLIGADAWTSFSLNPVIDTVMSNEVSSCDNSKVVNVTIFGTLASYTASSAQVTSLVNTFSTSCSNAIAYLGNPANIDNSDGVDARGFVSPANAEWTYKLRFILRTTVQTTSSITNAGQSPSSIITNNDQNASADQQKIINDVLVNGNGISYAYSLQLEWVPDPVLVQSTIRPISSYNIGNDATLNFTCAKSIDRLQAEYAVIIPEAGSPSNLPSTIGKIILGGPPKQAALNTALNTSNNQSVDNGPIHCYEQISTSSSTTCNAVDLDGTGLSCTSPQGDLISSLNAPPPDVKITTHTDSQASILDNQSQQTYLAMWQSYDPQADLTYVDTGAGAAHPNAVYFSLTAKPDADVTLAVGNNGLFCCRTSNITQPNVVPFCLTTGGAVSRDDNASLTFTSSNWSTPQPVYFSFFGCLNTNSTVGASNNPSQIVKISLSSCDAHFDNNSASATSCGANYLNANSDGLGGFHDVSSHVPDLHVYAALETHYFFVDKNPLFSTSVPGVKITGSNTATLHAFDGIPYGLNETNFRRSFRYRFIPTESIIHNKFYIFDFSDINSIAGRSVVYPTHIGDFTLDSHGIQNLAVLWAPPVAANSGVTLSDIPITLPSYDYTNQGAYKNAQSKYSIQFASGSAAAPPAKITAFLPYVHKRVNAPNDLTTGVCFAGSGLLLGDVAFYFPDMLPYAFSGTIADYHNYRLPSGKGFAQLGIASGGFILKAAVNLYMTTSPMASALNGILFIGASAAISQILSILVGTITNAITGQGSISTNSDGIGSSTSGTPSGSVHGTASGAHSAVKAAATSQLSSKLSNKVATTTNTSLLQKVTGAVVNKFNEVKNQPGMTLAKFLVTTIANIVIDYLVQFLQAVAVGAQDQTHLEGNCIDSYQCPCVLDRS